MDWPKNKPLLECQTEDPVLFEKNSHARIPSESSVMPMLTSRLGEGRSKRLTTWGREPDFPDGPHWIGVRNGTTLHTDPKYPRYTHHLVVICQGWALAGVSRCNPEILYKGQFFICDTHSPHILLGSPLGRSGPYYLAASIDSDSQLDANKCIKQLSDFIANWNYPC